MWVVYEVVWGGVWSVCVGVCGVWVVWGVRCMFEVCVVCWKGCVGCVCGAFGPAFKARTRVIFYIQSEDILTKRGPNFSPRFVTMCTVLTLP